MMRRFGLCALALLVSLNVASAQSCNRSEFGGAGSQSWLTIDYMLWWLSDAPGNNPLVTTGPFDPNTFVPGVTPPPGALTTPGTQVLAGNQSTYFGTFSGLQLQGGLALGDGVALEGGAFLLERRTAGYDAASNAAGEPFLGRPTIGAASGLENSVAISFANDAANQNGGQRGSVRIINSARLWGADVGASAALVDNEFLTVAGIVGFRYLDLDETLNISEIIQPFGQPGLVNGNLVPLGSIITGYDNFHTRNQFYGGTIGTRLMWHMPNFDLGLTTKVSLGSNQQRVGITGATSVGGAGLQFTTPGSVRAVPSNIGVYHRSEFAVVPEVGLNLGFRLSENIRLQVGYSFLYLSRAIRPDGTIDRVIDQTQVPTSQFFVPGAVGNRPLPQFEQSHLWAHGVNFGLSLRF